MGNREWGLVILQEEGMEVYGQHLLFRGPSQYHQLPDCWRTELGAQCSLPSDLAEEQNSCFRFASQAVHQAKAISFLVLSEVAEVGPGAVKVVSAISVLKTFGIAASDDMMNASVTGW